MVSMADVADLAGVSKATVSRVFNGNREVAGETRKRVLAACKKLDYKINSSIQDLAKEGKNGFVGNVAFVLVGRSFSAPGYSGLLDPIAEEVNNRNLHLMLEKLPGTPKSVFDLPPVLRDHRVDGIILTGALNRQTTEIFETLNIPTIVLGEYPREMMGELPQVGGGISFIYKKGIDHAFKNGVKKLALACENRESNYGQMLFNEYCAGLARWNIPYDDSLVFWGGGINRGIYNELLAIFQKGVLPFDAIIAGDYRAAEAINNLYAALSGFSRKPKLLLIWNKTVEHQMLMDEYRLENSSSIQICYSFDLLRKIQKKQIVPKITNI